jgi:lipopolysaccharide/colanic/teichoic acid biosynthesis glycosyltransferase
MNTHYRRWGKRAFDAVASATALTLLWPVLAVVSVLVRVLLGSPVLFRQERPGYHGRLFTLLKFRSMIAASDETGRTLPDEARLTRFARALRSTSLDELPELWNVLCGDMSLVGPRPLLKQYLERYTPEQARRHDVKPGMTGWAQVNGRNTLSWEDRFTLDVWYTDHLSCWLDLKIVALTLWKILVREGISSPGLATMHEFYGSKAEPPGPPQDSP